MDLTWRDAIATLALVVMIVVYAAYLQGSLWLISSTWATSAVVLMIGLGGRLVSVRGDARVRFRERFHGVLSVIGTAFAVIALIFGLAALVADSAYALKILIMASIVAWGAGTLSHV